MIQQEEVAVMKISNKGFGAYDIRGIYPEEVNEELAYRIGRVFVDLFHAKKVAIGHDIRLSGPSIRDALAKGLTEAGADVMDIGQCGTEMIYFATAQNIISILQAMKASGALHAELEII